ncbi:Rne/Rng family ribonuclease [Beijerinckia indica]|uniref:Ribonuclease E n=1 Tax=Beijerinckia indica subsp. indica (strain ATCC 9039 / DSM 1715 / NCIMB 8712) TaxID=395963 RepID=B2IHQ6_BEII9|nr:ribonuclease E/G [Beijerinckia indica]ACB94580.1 ribonuclease, Rne/Rng family [Beijerinckia indica subsp. indica ATCC 9039]
MANKMLIDASHPEETRVVVLRGNRVEEFDFESASKKQLRGNIYLAKVTRVEPSLQAAFVDYGGNRHGFLAFSEIHPDYYQIPVVDRQALIEEEARAQHEEDEEPQAPRRSRRYRRGDRNGQRAAEKRRNEDDVLALSPVLPEAVEPAPDQAEMTDEPQAFYTADSTDHFPHFENGAVETPDADETQADEPFLFPPHETTAEELQPSFQSSFPASEEEPADFTRHEQREVSSDENDEAPSEELPFNATELAGTAVAAPEAIPTRDDFGNDFNDDEGDEGDETEEEDEQVEQIGGDSDAMEEAMHRAPRYRRQYKIQEVIKRRQILLVQVVKEERGNKGAALTTYLSLAGRYSVLMPNTARGGGISRKITDAGDRQRLKAIAQELEVPEGMGVILRTAGAARTKAEVKRDFEYLLRMWETVREMTLKSTAPTLVYEEGSLIKRAIRDLYNKDIDEIIVSGEAGYREAKDFMRMLMPSHAKSVQLYRDPQPIFAKAGAEAQLDAMFSNQVTLRSGGYLVINQTEALVAIDVNSGRSTREHNIEDTAVRTNLEAADEIARQLRLRDLAGLIVADFIDMEEGRNNRAVERRLKEALKNDRARIQVGRISHFGLLEMSRQRIRTGVFEGSTVICPHCLGAGMVRSTSSIALHVLRLLEDALIKNAAYDITVKTRTVIALYILNQKRTNLRELEQRFGVSITVAADESLTGMTYHALERGELASGTKLPVRETAIGPADIFPLDEEEEIEMEAEELEPVSGSDEGSNEDEEATAEAEGETEADGRARRRRRKRRRGGRGSDREGSGIAANAPQPSDDALGLIAGMSPYAAADDENAAAFTASEAEETRDEETEGAETVEAKGEDIAPAPNRRPRRSRSRGPRRANAEAAESSAGSATETAISQEPFEPESSLPSTGAEAEHLAPSQPVELSHAEDFAPVLSPAAPEEPHIVESVPVAPVALPMIVPEQGSTALVPVEAEAETASITPPVEESGPPQPKRSGWWQRAKASLRG